MSGDELSNLDWNYLMAGHDGYMKDGKYVPCDCMACEKRYGVRTEHKYYDGKPRTCEDAPCCGCCD